MNIKNLLGFAEPAAAPVKIRTLRAMILTGTDGKTRHVDAGEELTITADCFRQLDRSDREVLDSGRPALPDVSDPSPAREEIRPLPDRWNELPECYRTYHNITEKLRTGRDHLEAIRATRVAVFGTDIRMAELVAHGGATALAGSAMMANPREGWTRGVISTVKPLSPGDPRNLRVCDYLTAAENGAIDYLDRLKTEQGENLQRAFLECGRHRLAVAQELHELLEGLAAVGFELFSVRTSALQLADYQVRRLFHGSADFQRFGNHSPAILQGTSSAGLNPATGEMVIYSDVPVGTQASWSLSLADRLAALQPLLADGRKELNKARKVSAAAA